MDYSKYGLTKTNADKSDYDKGIVSDGRGGYLKIDGFSREQNDDLDTDQGDVFKSSLYKDSGADFSNFNTAKDVEGALAQLGGGPKEDKTPIAHSPKVAHAKARIAQYEEDVYSGKYADDLWNNKSKEASDNFLDRYKMKLGKQDDDGNYFEPEEV